MHGYLELHDVLTFAQEAETDALKVHEAKWNVLIVDDDSSVHQAIKLSLRKLIYEDRGIQFFSAHDCDMAKKLMRSIEDIAVVLLDISVSRKEDGLELVEFIRNNLKNKKTRIVIMTGNISSHISKNTISDYDINDFKPKTDLTVQTLYTTIVSLLRAYSDILHLESKEKELQAAYKTSEVRMKAVNASNTGIAITDAEGVITWCNSSFVEITGFNEVDIVGQVWERLLITNKVKKSYGKNDYSFHMKDGKRKIAEVRYENVIDEDAFVLNSVIALHDITERENAKRSLYKDIEMARKVQRSVLPKPIENDWIRVQGIHKATEKVGGDMFFWELQGDTTLNLILLDVMGHGIATALVTMYLRSVISDHFDLSSNPCDLLINLQNALSRINESVKDDIDYYFTCVVMTVNKLSGDMTYVNAGHPNVVMTLRSGGVRKLESTILPIGIIPYDFIEAQHCSLDEVENILLYSDGLLDMSSKITQGFDSPMVPGVSIKSQIMHCFNRVEQETYSDDISLIWLEMLGTEGAE